jgi:hypothetical protein
VLLLVAAAHIHACVVLHLVALTQSYFQGEGTLGSQPDQVVLYSVLAAGWVGVLVVSLLGRDRVAIGAALAVGLAATELGFRVSDLGSAINAGISEAGSGLWMLTVAWVLGAAGTVLLVVAARSPISDTAGVTAEPADGRYDRTAGWITAVGVLGVAAAALYLPPWDHYVLTATVSGEVRKINLGNGLSGPWPVVLGNLIVAGAIFAAALVAILLRHRRVGAALVVGSLVALGSQMASAVIQVDQPVSPAAVGLAEGTARELGVVINVSLTSWFALDALAALVLLATVTVWAVARVVRGDTSTVSPAPPVAATTVVSSSS